MSNEKFLIYLGWDVADLGRHQGVDMSVAPDMFCENLETYVEGEPVHYEGANVDYKALSEIWKSMTAEEKANCKIAYRHFRLDLADEIAETRRVGSEAKFMDLAFNYNYVPDKVAPDYVLFEVAYDIALDSYKNHKDILTARDEYIANVLDKGETPEAKVWVLKDAQLKDNEKEWFYAKVSLSDGGLLYGIMKEDRKFFNSVLTSRC